MQLESLHRKSNDSDGLHAEALNFAYIIIGLHGVTVSTLLQTEKELIRNYRVRCGVHLSICLVAFV